MDIDCKCYFWERKVGATLVGGLFFGVVYGSMTAYSDQEPTMILCYSLLLGLSTGLAAYTLIAESYCNCGGHSSIGF